MDIKFVGPNGEEEMEVIDIEQISEITLKKFLLKNREISILVKKYKVGDYEVPFANITLEKDSNVREFEGKILADLMFDYYEYKNFEHYGEVLSRNGMKLIKVTVAITKDDIMMAAARMNKGVWICLG